MNVIYSDYFQEAIRSNAPTDADISRASAIRSKTLPQITIKSETGLDLLPAPVAPATASRSSTRLGKVPSVRAPRQNHFSALMIWPHGFRLQDYR
jgi:hypothetical protein